jgi:hypothetical protein
LAVRHCLLLVPFRLFRSSARDDGGERGDHNENDRTTDSDDVETGYGPREENRCHNRDSSE